MKYRVNIKWERVQSTETSKVSIAWQRIKVVLLLIIQIIEWIKTKTKINNSFFNKIHCTLWTWNIFISHDESNHLIACMDNNDVNVSIVSHPSQVFRFKWTGNYDIYISIENDKWLNVIEINRRNFLREWQVYLSRESRSVVSHSRVCVQQASRLPFDPIVHSRDCCVMTNTLTTISLMSISIHATTTTIQTLNPDG
jgi:hypothetical protein